MITLILLSLAILIQLLLLNNPNGINSWLLTIPHILILASGVNYDFRKTKSVYSPYSVFSLIYFFVICTPIILSQKYVGVLHLTDKEILTGSGVYLLFLCALTLSYQVLSLFTTKNRDISSSDIDRIYSSASLKLFSRILLFLGTLGVLIHLYSLSSSHGFNLILFIQSPLEVYSVARQEGRNWAIILRSFIPLYIMTVPLRISREVNRDAYLSKVKLVVIGSTILFFALISGKKEEFFWPLVAILAIQGYSRSKINLKYSAILLFASVAIIAFTFIWRGTFLNVNELPRNLIEYNHAFNYTAKTATMIVPNHDYFFEAAEDLTSYLVPRTLWPEKPILMGLTRKYLQFWLISFSLPNTSSFPTMGLSEIWISTGYFGVVLAGLFLALLLSWTRKELRYPKGLATYFYAAYLYGSIYFILRVGFLNVYVYNLIIPFIFAIGAELIAKAFTRKTIK